MTPALPGQSYNPAFDDHQELISSANAVEVQKRKEHNRLRRTLDDMFPTQANAPTEVRQLSSFIAAADTLT